MTIEAHPDWNYTELATHYDHRPDYNSALVREALADLRPDRRQPWLEIGAGTGKLTRLLSPHAGQLLAVEPNSAMRRRGLFNTAGRAVQWLAARGEQVPLLSESVSLIAYGSSWNVLRNAAAHHEAIRLLNSGGIWLALWNHRDLDDPLQREVQSIIQHYVPLYEQGSRRENPLPELIERGGFRDAGHCQCRFEIDVNGQDWIDAWRSHGTLQRQAGDQWEAIQSAIARCAEQSMLASGSGARIRVPYHTRLYWARRT